MFSCDQSIRLDSWPVISVVDRSVVNLAGVWQRDQEKVVLCLGIGKALGCG